MQPPIPDRPALERLAAHIRSLPKKPADRVFEPGVRYFDWANWSENEKGPSCGTYGCVAGWAADLFPDRVAIVSYAAVPVVDGIPNRFREALEAFGLTADESDAIALGTAITDEGGTILVHTIGNELSRGTPEEAADRILMVLGFAEGRRRALDTPTPPSVPSEP